MDIIKAIEAEQMRNDIPDFKVGDTLKIDVKVVENGRERIQSYEGILIARKGGGLCETINVRRNSYGVGVERIFPIHSPKIAKITVTRHGRVRRAKLYYLRGRVGKAAKVKELKEN